MNTQLACPHCRSTQRLSFNGNLLDTPLICQACGQSFAPHFYCPDARASSRHVFEANVLRIDNANSLYAFCPEHTFTTYALTAECRSRPKRTHLRAIAHFFDSLVFRLALNLEALRLQAFSRR